MRFLHDRTDLGPKTGATPPAGAYSVWFCTLTARNRLDISAGRWNTSPIYGKVGSAVGLKSLSAAGRAASTLAPKRRLGNLSSSSACRRSNRLELEGVILMHRSNSFVALWLVVLGTAVGLSPGRIGLGVEIAPYQRPIGAKAADAFVPYMASHRLKEPNRNITRVLFSFHSSGFDAMQYYENARLAASKVPGAVDETLIIAPQFLESSVVPKEIPNGLLYWQVSPYRGSSRGAVGPGGRKVGISAFEVIDDWLNESVASKNLPNLEDVVLVGHSAGGQLVQRYAMVGKFEPAGKIKCRYVVSAPSSYAYPSGERYDPMTNSFAIPNAKTQSACPDYNKWGYGLDVPYAYFSDVNLEVIAKRYGERSVFYLCGERDTDPNDKTMGKSCGAMMQGRHRLERMQVFAAYLRQQYGESINRRQSSATVPGVGHYGRGTMTSESGLKFLFAPLR